MGYFSSFASYQCILWSRKQFCFVCLFILGCFVCFVLFCFPSICYKVALYTVYTELRYLGNVEFGLTWNCPVCISMALGCQGLGAEQPVWAFRPFPPGLVVFVSYGPGRIGPHFRAPMHALLPTLQGHQSIAEASFHVSLRETPFLSKIKVFPYVDKWIYNILHEIENFLNCIYINPMMDGLWFQ